MNTPVGDFRLANAEAARGALCALRARLQRHADALEEAARSRRGADWLVAVDDATKGSATRGDSASTPLDDGDDLVFPALESLADIARLSAFERRLLLLVAAPSLDGAFARAYAEIQADVTRPHATLHLALSLFVAGGAQRLLALDCLMPSGTLRKLRLLDVGGEEVEPLLTRRLAVDERVADYLRGVNRLDARLAPFLSPLHEALPTESATEASRRAAALIEADSGRWATINLVDEPDGSAREAARLACVAMDLHPHLLDLRRFAECDAAERASLVGLLGREAVLGGLALVVDAAGAERGNASARAVDELVASLGATLFVISSERWPGPQMFALRTARPTRLEQRALWRAALGAHGSAVNGELDAITQQFDFGPAAIAEVAERSVRSGGVTGRSLWAACREQTGGSLEDLARRLVPRYGWDDIVVGDDVRAQLRELAAQVAQRGRVHESWGFGPRLGRGRGITALFAGPSGTGKTMAAEVLAGHLALDLYRIDLSSVVSKYVGDTEKNLRRVFDAAERSGAILFFDEADALFGNRTEVRDSHDRYANLEINYLLQRMEDYTGLAVLASNRRASLDNAFLRRLRFVIEFPFPSADDRRRIWERVFPREAQVQGLERSLLAGLDLSGGNIKSVAINAAFLAASEDEPIGMPHVMRAAAREYAKLSKPISASEFGPYYATACR